MESFAEVFGIVTHLGGDIADHNIDTGYIASIRSQLCLLNSVEFNKTFS